MCVWVRACHIDGEVREQGQNRTTRNSTAAASSHVLHTHTHTHTRAHRHAHTEKERVSWATRLSSLIEWTTGSTNTSFPKGRRCQCHFRTEQRFDRFENQALRRPRSKPVQTDLMYQFAVGPNRTWSSEEECSVEQSLLQNQSGFSFFWQDAPH